MPLFGQLYISTQSHEGDLKVFFAHEIKSFPSSLSDFGKLHLPNTKSLVLKCLEQPEQPEPPSTYDCIILDGAVIVHSLPTIGVNTYNVYAEKVLHPYLGNQLQNVTRLDVVWDTYLPDSLKESTHEKRGKGVHRKVLGQTKLPGKWMDFLHDPKNKLELFAFLTSKVGDFVFPPDKSVFITSGESVVSVGSKSPLMNCNHEEANTNVVVHSARTEAGYEYCKSMHCGQRCCDHPCWYIL